MAGAEVVRCTTMDGTYFQLSGTATYDWVPALTASEPGGPGLDYTQAETRPVRRAIVRAMNEPGAVLTEAVTDDQGAFSLSVPGGCGPARIVVLAKSQISEAVPDSFGPDNCAGANWDVRVVDNTNSKATWGIYSSSYFSTPTSGLSVHGPYASRAAGPFAILDTIVTQMEFVCQANPTQSFPLLYMNWSPNNVTNSNGTVATGRIGTSYFDTDSSGIANIFILGEKNVDTDEFDDHVIAHEYGHYLEHSVFRADSIGGSHSAGNVLDTRVAFGEGYGNAIAGMSLNDPVYVDSSGSGESSGFSFDVSAIPIGNDKGIYSETSVQYLLWKLYASRRLENPAAPFDRIYNVLKTYQAQTPALTTVVSFAAYYSGVYGEAANGFKSLWETDLRTPYDALCTGSCADPGATTDPFDSDNDIGLHYATGAAGQRTYGGVTYSAPFWQLYKPYSVGMLANAHDSTVWGGYSYPINKYGNSRFYTFTAVSSGTATVKVDNLVGASCTEDVIDLFVYSKGKTMTYGGLPTEDLSEIGTRAGCPSITFNTNAGQLYVFEVRGWSGPGKTVSSWRMTVSQ